jgi:hypothetical protein
MFDEIHEIKSVVSKEFFYHNHESIICVCFFNPYVLWRNTVKTKIGM